MRSSSRFGAAAAAVAVLWLGGPAESARTASTPKAQGAIQGRVVLEGKAPKDRKISLEGDKYCGAARPEGLLSESYKVNAKGEIQNVFVYVKKGLENAKFEAPKEPVLLDQSGCRYDPHVFGIQVGQELKIRNSDETLHNVHALSQVNPEFNFGQGKKGDESVRTFAAPEVMVKIKCDVHGWMSSFAGVLPHPHFKVTGEDGTFELKGLPAGAYTLEAWHEKFGTQVQDVKVDPAAPVQVTFTFKGK
jgi:plastocyanin